MWHVGLDPRARKKLAKLPKEVQDYIKIKLLKLAENPYTGKKLQGDLKRQYVIRVWPYRVIYEIYRQKLFVLVITIEHRQGVYK